MLLVAVLRQCIFEIEFKCLIVTDVALRDVFKGDGLLKVCQYRHYKELGKYFVVD